MPLVWPGVWIVSTVRPATSSSWSPSIVPVTPMHLLVGVREHLQVGPALEQLAELLDVVAVAVGEQDVRRRQAELVGLVDQRRDRAAGVDEERLAALVRRDQVRVGEVVIPHGALDDHGAQRTLAPVSERRQAVIDLGSNSFRLVVFTWSGEGRAAWWKRTDEIHEAVRIGAGPRRDRRARRRSRWSARCRCSSSTRTSAARPASPTCAPVATSAIRDAANQAEFLEAGAAADVAGDRRAPARGARRATATSPRSTRRRWPTASRSTSAAARCS